MSHIKKSVIITWEDAWSNNKAYFNPKSIIEEGPCMVTSIGFVIRDNKAGISLAHEDFGSDEYRSIQHIPRAMIRKIRILK